MPSIRETVLIGLISLLGSAESLAILPRSTDEPTPTATAAASGAADDIASAEFWSLCSRTTEPARRTSYSACMDSVSAATSCATDDDACACSWFNMVATECLPEICPTAAGSSLISFVGCAGAGAVLTDSLSATGTTTIRGGSEGTITGSTSGTTATGGSSNSDDDDTKGSGSGSGSPKSTSTSSAFAGDVSVPVTGGFLAGLIGVAAFLL